MPAIECRPIRCRRLSAASFPVWDHPARRFDRFWAGGRRAALLALLSAFWVAGGPLCAQDAAAASGASTAQGAAADLVQYQGQYRSVADPEQVHAIYVEGGALYEEREGAGRQKLNPDPSPARPTASALRRQQRMWCLCAMEPAQSPGCGWCWTAAARPWMRRRASAWWWRDRTSHASTRASR